MKNPPTPITKSTELMIAIRTLIGILILGINFLSFFTLYSVLIGIVASFLISGIEEFCSTKSFISLS